MKEEEREGGRVNKVKQINHNRYKSLTLFALEQGPCTNLVFWYQNEGASSSHSQLQLQNRKHLLLVTRFQRLKHSFIKVLWLKHTWILFHPLLFTPHTKKKHKSLTVTLFYKLYRFWGNVFFKKFLSFRNSQKLTFLCFLYFKTLFI